MAEPSSPSGEEAVTAASAGPLAPGWSLAARLRDAWDVTPASTRRGSPWLALPAGLVLLGVVAPSVAAGVHHHLVRHAGAATWLGLAGVSVLVAFVWPLGEAWTVGRASARLGVGLALVMSVFALAATSAPTFDGVPSHSGGDMGTHAMFFRQLTEDGTQTYRGMVAPYMLARAITGVSGGEFLDGARALYDWTWIAVVGAGVIALVSVLPTRGGSEARRTLVLGGFAGVVFVDAVALPMIVYFEQDGFVAQVVALAPMSVAVVVYATARRRFVRVLVLVAWIPVLRFTYALNLGDTMLAASVLTIVEAAAARREGVGARATTLIVGLAVVIAAASVAVYTPLYGRHRIPGGFLAGSLEDQAIGGVWLGLALVGAAFDARTDAGAQVLGRLGLAAGLTILIPSAIVGAWLGAAMPVAYYVYKYPFAGMTVASVLAGPVLAATLVRSFRARPGGAAYDVNATNAVPWARARAVAWSVVGCLGIAALARSTAPYRALVVERGLSSSVLRPGTQPVSAAYLEADTSAIITRVLERTGARFGGFLTNRWPESQYTNARFADEAAHMRGQFVTHGVGLKGLTQGTSPVMAPGHCVFAYDPRRQLPAGPNAQWPPGGQQTARSVVLDESAQCQAIDVAGQPDRNTAVCWRCYEETGDRRILLPFGPEVGPYAIERDAERPDLAWRWTDGEAVVAYQTSAYDARRECEMYVDALGDRPFEILFDGQSLGPGKVQRVPPQPRGSRHRITLRSPTFVPSEADAGSSDRRALGIAVSRIELRCGPGRRRSSG